MFGFMRNVVMFTSAGILLAVLFLSLAGAVVGAINGLIVGACVGLGEWKAQRAELVASSAAPIRLIGSF